MSTITVQEVEELIKDSIPSNVELIDVREPFELAVAKIPGVKNIPLGELPNHINEFKKDKTYIMVCRSGNRSGVATNYLRQVGINATNMVGGMVIWGGPVE
ncbi:MAG TPA: rhodanese-like domain-containing protein [Massilibacterium sp.]|nr:rhodanese-like domain-containing protein [Massilibacterium sp.]